MDLRIDRAITSPALSTQIATQIGALIRIGGLPQGSALPATRRLATALEVSRGVVVEAYDQLRLQGLVSSKIGSGTRVAPLPQVDSSPRPRRRGRAHAAAWRIDLNPEVPDIATFPRTSWRASLELGLSSLPTHGLDYRALHGVPALREALAAFLARTRRIDVQPEDLVLCGGYRQALLIVSNALRANGVHELALSRVGHRIHRVLMPETGLSLRWLDIDTDGVVLDPIDASGPGTAVLINPLHQFPLGTPLSAARTQGLLGSDVVLIEDDSNAHLQHRNPMVPALQSFRPNNTIYIGSLSRSLAPGIRLGFIVAPGAIGQECAQTARLWGVAPSAIEQAALAHFIASGALERHQRLLRIRYRQKAQELRSLLASALPATRAIFPTSGFHALLEITNGTSESAVADEAARRGIRVYRLSDHVLNGPPLPATLVIGYGAVSRNALIGLARDLRDVVNHVSQQAGLPAEGVSQVVAGRQDAQL